MLEKSQQHRQGGDKQTIAQEAVELLSAAAKWADHFIPDELHGDNQKMRKASLQLRFGFASFFFCIAYALFYALIGHTWGAAIIGASGMVPILSIQILKTEGGVRLLGNLYSASLVVIFVSLSLIEGGMHGHAVAWLACVPLCALLLAHPVDAGRWAAVTVVITIVFCISHVVGVEFPVLFPEKWTRVIDAAGYAGLIPFIVILGVVFEVTRQHAHAKLEIAMKELRTANSRLTRLNEEKNEFFNIAAHDLKNPLANVSGFASILQDPRDLTYEQVVEYSTDIKESSTRMLGLIDKLLDIKSIDAGSSQLHMEGCDLRKELIRVEREFAESASKKGINLSVKRIDLPLLVTGDSGSISQIVDNLVYNAIKYSPLHSWISVATRETSRGVVFEVVDEGPGLSEEDQAKLFRKFQRLTPQPTAEEGANGLGLWIVDRLARNMGGSTFCRSELGRCSTFGVELSRWRGVGFGHQRAAGNDVSNRPAQTEAIPAKSGESDMVIAR